ncbi:MAG: hypothetical protein WCT31_04110 [Candidatus Micrarchaeia archaeon]
MKTITVISDDRIGLLSDITYILGKSRINIEGVNVDICSGKAIIAITVKNVEKAEKVLCENGYLISGSDSLILKYPKCENCVGKITEILAKQRILVENANMISDDVSNCFISMNVNRPRKAVKMLGDFLVNRPVA